MLSKKSRFCSFLLQWRITSKIDIAFGYVSYNFLCYARKHTRIRFKNKEPEPREQKMQLSCFGVRGIQRKTALIFRDYTNKLYPIAWVSTCGKWRTLYLKYAILQLIKKTLKPFSFISCWIETEYISNCQSFIDKTCWPSLN